MKRHIKVDPRARCCWVCGKLGGAGFTTALRYAGYDVPRGEIGYAHPVCMRRAQLKASANRK